MRGPGVTYSLLTEVDQSKVRESAKERYLAYLFIQNSGSQHELLQRELQNDYTKGSDHYPDCHSTVLMFLDRYSKNQVVAPVSEGTAFTQKSKTKKGKKGDASDNKYYKKEPYDKDFYKDKLGF